MIVLAVRFDLHIPASQSLKQRRSALRPVVDGIRARFSLSVAEVGGGDTWQRAEVGVAIVGSDHGVVEDVADAVERFVWSFPELVVLDNERTWMEYEGQMG